MFFDLLIIATLLPRQMRPGAVQVEAIDGVLVGVVVGVGTTSGYRVGLVEAAGVGVVEADAHEGEAGEGVFGAFFGSEPAVAGVGRGWEVGSAELGVLRRWQREGVWAQILTALRIRADAAGLITWEVSVDSTVCRAHQHAAGARRDGDSQVEPPGGVFVEPADHALGRSRGGFSTKIHLAVEQGQKPMSVLVTAGQAGDSPQFTAVLDAIRVPRVGPGRPRTRPERVRFEDFYRTGLGTPANFR